MENYLDYLIFIILIICLLRYLIPNNQENLTVSENSNTANPKLINFNASWCYYSRELEPVWDKLKEGYKNMPVDILNYKCDTSEYEDICKQNDIQGYPTIKLIANGNVIDYNEPDRSLQSFSKFINENVSL